MCSVTQGNVPFYAFDTLLQFSRFEKVPADTQEAVRERYLWALDHEDLGICTLGMHALLFVHAMPTKQTLVTKPGVVPML